MEHFLFHVHFSSAYTHRPANVQFNLILFLDICYFSAASLFSTYINISYSKNQIPAAFTVQLTPPQTKEKVQLNPWAYIINTAGSITVQVRMLHLLNRHQIFLNELLLTCRKGSCGRGSFCSLAIIRRQSVTAVSDRWVGLWVLNWFADTKFHWHSEYRGSLSEQGFGGADRLIKGCGGRSKRQAEARGERDKEGESEGQSERGDWRVCVISLLLSRFWSCRSADDENFGRRHQHKLLRHSEQQGNTDKSGYIPVREKPSSPSRQRLNDAARATSENLQFSWSRSRSKSAVCRVVTVQEGWTNSRADRYNAVKGAWNNLCGCSRDAAHHRSDSEVELLWETISQELFPPHYSLFMSPTERSLFWGWLTLASNCRKAMEYTHTSSTLHLYGSHWVVWSCVLQLSRNFPTFYCPAICL